MRVSVILSAILFPMFLIAQKAIVLTDRHADCSGAIEITDSIWGPVTAPTGPGEIMEFNAPHNSPYFFASEHHTVWYILNIDRNCKLSFEIIPESINDDYDFVLLKYDGSLNFCERVAKGMILPVRSVISRNDKNIGSRTGLKKGYKQKNIRSGPGKSFAAPIEVEKGERYYLVLDNVYAGGKGHKIRFYYSECIDEQKGEEKEKSQPPSILPDCFISVVVSDKKTGEMLNSNIRLKAIGEKPEEENFKDVSSLIKGLNPSTTYDLYVEVPGYFSHSSEFRSPPKHESLSINIKLDKIEAGNKIILDNIYFQGGTAQFVSSSYPALRNLLRILRENPTVKIEIQGHVNKPLYLSPSEGDSPERLQELSDQRAFAVYEYLIRRGIQRERMSHKGYSNTQMIAPYARSAEEQQKNRRVEILILEI